MARIFASFKTLTVQKSRVLLVDPVSAGRSEASKGEAVVVYCEPLATKEMRCPRLSRRVNNMAFLRGPCSNSQIVMSYGAYENERKPSCVMLFNKTKLCCLCNVRVYVTADSLHFFHNLDRIQCREFPVFHQHLPVHNDILNVCAIGRVNDSG